MLYFFPAELTNDGHGTQQNFILSKYDTYYINTVYPTKNPDAAKEFYKKVYGQDLGEYSPITIGDSGTSVGGVTSEAPNESQAPIERGEGTPSNSTQNDNSDKNKKMLMIAGVVVSILVIIMILYFLL